jgi:hypothetical protein
MCIPTLYLAPGPLRRSSPAAGEAKTAAVEAKTAAGEAPTGGHSTAGEAAAALALRPGA